MTTIASIDSDCLAYILDHLPTCRQRAKLVMANGHGAFAQRVLMSRANVDCIHVDLNDKPAVVDYYFGLLFKVNVKCQPNYQSNRHCGPPMTHLPKHLKITPPAITTTDMGKAQLMNILLHHSSHIESLTVATGKNYRTGDTWFLKSLQQLTSNSYVFMPHLKRLSLAFNHTSVAYVQAWLFAFWLVASPKTLLDLSIQATNTNTPALKALFLPYLPSLQSLSLNLGDRTIYMACPEHASLVDLQRLKMKNLSLLEFVKDDDVSRPKFINATTIDLPRQVFTPIGHSLTHFTSSGTKQAGSTHLSVLEDFIYNSYQHADVQACVTQWATQRVEEEEADFFQTHRAQIQACDRCYDKSRYALLTKLKLTTHYVYTMFDYASLRRFLLFATHLTTLDLSNACLGESALRQNPTNAGLFLHLNPGLIKLNLDSVCNLQCDLSACLRRLTCLQYLKMNDTGLYVYDDCPQDAHLKRVRDETRDDYCFLSNDALPTSLTYLDLSGAKFGITAISSAILYQTVARLPHLETLDLDSVTPKMDFGVLLNALTCHDTLTRLSLYNCHVFHNELVFDGIERFRRLRVLDISGKHFTWYLAVVDGNHIHLNMHRAFSSMSDYLKQPLKVLSLPSLPLEKTGYNYYVTDPWFRHLLDCHAHIEFGEDACVLTGLEPKDGSYRLVLETIKL